MGANPWHYFTPYDADLNAVLQNLKEQEFRAGRYGFEYSVEQDLAALQNMGADLSGIPDELLNRVDQPQTSAEDLIEAYGSLSAAMAAVLEDSAPDGTSSILDMLGLSDQPEICAACPLSTDELQTIFQTAEPTRAMIEAILINWAEEGADTFWESIGRGEGRYIIVYQAGQPAEVFFAGYSFD